jgi:hypothetical protein
LETHSDEREAIGSGRLPAFGDGQANLSSIIGVDLPIPQKPTFATVRRWPTWQVQFRYVTQYKGGSGGDQAGAAAAPWRGARPFDGRPGASRLFGGRRRATCPRC